MSVYIIITRTPCDDRRRANKHFRIFILIPPRRYVIYSPTSRRPLAGKRLLIIQIKFNRFGCVHRVSRSLFAHEASPNTLGEPLDIFCRCSTIPIRFCFLSWSEKKKKIRQMQRTIKENCHLRQIKNY